MIFWPGYLFLFVPILKLDRNFYKLQICYSLDRPLLQINKCSKKILNILVSLGCFQKGNSFFPSLDSLVQVKICKPLWRVFGQGDLAVVEDYPATLLQDVTDVVTDHMGCAHVRNESHLWKNIKMSLTHYLNIPSMPQYFWPNKTLHRPY